MKYIITESRRDVIVQNFLEDHVGYMERHLHPSTVVDYEHWTDKNNKTTFEVDNGDLGVSEVLWNTIKTMFNLTPHETDTALLEFFHSQTGRYFPDGIYTFEVD
jgi:hypothetical protein